MLNASSSHFDPMKTAGTSIPAVWFKSHHASTIDRFMALLMLLPPFIMTMSVGRADELLRRGSERLAFLHHVDGG
jgi:hypothetical protein